MRVQDELLKQEVNAELKQTETEHSLQRALNDDEDW